MKSNYCIVIIVCCRYFSRYLSYMFHLFQLDFKMDFPFPIECKDDLIRLETYAKVCNFYKKLNYNCRLQFLKLIKKCYCCLLHFKDNPTELEGTLRGYENPKAFLLKVSSYSLIDNMALESPSNVSFNWKGIKKCSE